MSALPEVWGGAECTLNRVGDSFFDQGERSGHWRRWGDFDRFASLGLAALRVPLLWERTAPRASESPDWRWADGALSRLQEFRIRPIVGMVHHGSGPRHTSLVSADFPSGLARYARAVAERFPWVTDFTPINEPLTTARFSGLYGHWYPHARDDFTFVRALLTQCRAIVESMRAIREVTPAARLIQTEDMGETFSTPALADQAEFENHRRWLSFDLLCGRVDRLHPLRKYLLDSGAGPSELDFFQAHPTPPDVVGLNYYLTSDRYLDERLERYPAWSHGGNGRQRYADVEAVRAWPPGLTGHRLLLERALQRYALPVALTEVHLGCSREEQLRWLREAWDAAKGLRAEGKNVEAITVWSLLGAFDWNGLVTHDRGHYEPGAFDVRSPGIRETALGTMARALATGAPFDHPVLEQPGWWRRPNRLWGDPSAAPIAELKGRTASPVLIVGGEGALGRTLARECKARGLEYRCLSHAQVDTKSVEAAMTTYAPWAVIHAPGIFSVEEAESDPQRCLRENVLGLTVLADACRQREVQLLSFSSHQVFDGQKVRPYLESDCVAPLNVLGRSQSQGEEAALARHSSTLIVRTSACFASARLDGWEGTRFVSRLLDALERGHPFRASSDQIVSPTFAPDLVNVALDLLIDAAQGIWHLAHPEAVSWLTWGRRVAATAHLDERLVHGASHEALGWHVQQPRNGALGSERGDFLSGLDDALRRHVAERGPRAERQVSAS